MSSSRTRGSRSVFDIYMVQFTHMKIIKTFALVSVLTIGLTTSVFASWWNPFTWNWFKKQTPVTTQQVVINNISIATSTSENKSDELKDWKTYTNKEYGFEIKYPSDWSFKDISSSTRNPSIVIKSKTRLNLPGYENVPVYFRAVIISNLSNTGKVISKTGHFSTIKEVPNQQDAFNVNINQQTEENTNEYKIWQQILSTFKFTSVSENKNEITIITNDGGITFDGGTILFAKDNSGKKWMVDYKNVKYYENFIRDGQELSRVGDFDFWLKTHKQVSSPNYDGPGIPGVTKIIGIVDEKGTVQASKIIQHVQ